MYLCKFLKKTYCKHILIFIPILFSLDIMMTLYDNGIEHIAMRHIFSRQDLLTCFANILFWVLLYIPIIVDTIDDLSTLCVSTMVRIKPLHYIFRKLNALVVYCILWFSTSFLLSFLNSIFLNYNIGEMYQVVLLFFLLLLSSAFLLLFHVFITWLFKSAHISTIIYFCILLLFQSFKIENANLIQKMMHNKEIAIIACLLGISITMVLWLIVIRKTDYIGIKKGVSI